MKGLRFDTLLTASITLIVACFSLLCACFTCSYVHTSTLYPLLHACPPSHVMLMSIVYMIQHLCFSNIVFTFLFGSVYFVAGMAAAKGLVERK